MKRPHCGLLVLVGLAACEGVFSNPRMTTQDAPTPDTPPVDGQIVFTTSQRYRGGLLGGVEGADAICANHASEAGLAGEFKAWISQLDSSAADRLTHSTRPYVLVNGTEVAGSWTDLLNVDLMHAIDLDEHGEAPMSDPTIGDAVWSDTRGDGREFPWTPGGDMTRNPRLDCTLWSSIDGGVGLLGSWSATDAGWTGMGGGIACNQTAHLYCFQQ